MNPRGVALILVTAAGMGALAGVTTARYGAWTLWVTGPVGFLAGIAAGFVAYEWDQP